MSVTDDQKPVLSHHSRQTAQDMFFTSMADAARKLNKEDVQQEWLNTAQNLEVMVSVKEVVLSGTTLKLYSGLALCIPCLDGLFIGILLLTSGCFTTLTDICAAQNKTAQGPEHSHRTL